ncbi:MAG: hypothetical protein ACUVXA_17900 [Candidatus Jordarchaeum sp.]|uniref:hypothetical protein n=1 Tax=Candidatus Jordarchaeum sp. TaxID=2823881 RepID=UPI0040499B50
MIDENNCYIKNLPHIYKILENVLDDDYKQVLYIVSLLLGQYYEQRFFSYDKSRLIMEDVVSVCGLPLHYTREEIMNDVFLVGEDWNVFFPVGGIKGDCLAWGNRLSLPSSGEMYEIPRVVSLAIKKFEEEQIYENWLNLVKEYFSKIGATYAEKTSQILQYAINQGICNMINASSIEEGCISVGLKNSGAIIAEMKGGGIISPSVHCGIFLRKPEIFTNNEEEASIMKKFISGAPIYQLNKALITWFSNEKEMSRGFNRCFTRRR